MQDYQLTYNNNPTEQREIPLEEILADNEFNCREEEISPETIIDLVESIKEHGLIEPIVVQPIEHATNPNLKYRIVAGYRRFSAVKFLKLKTINCSVRYDLTNDASIVVNFIENNERHPLNIMQEAGVVRKLHGLGYLDDMIRSQLKVSYDWLRVRNSALILPEPVQKMIAAGELTQNQIKELGWSIKQGKENGYDATEAVIRAAAKMRDRKTKVEQSVIKPDIETVEEKEKKSLSKDGKIVLRSVKDIEAIQGELMDVLGENFASRVVAWICSTITTSTLLEELKIEARFMGVEYTPNKELQGL